LRDHDRAEDLTQETFIKALDALRTHDPECDSGGWIRRIGYNAAIDYVRIKRLPTVPLFNTAEASPEPPTYQVPAAPVAGRTASSEANKSAVSQALNQALRHLPRDQRRCIKLRFFEKRTNHEVAQILGMPLGGR